MPRPTVCNNYCVLSYFPKRHVELPYDVFLHIKYAYLGTGRRRLQDWRF